MNDHVERNRAFWNGHSDEYQKQHADHISPDRMAWGVWQIAEDEVHALPAVDGKDVLELGCGACQWSIALARRGARCVGLDFSDRQLGHARRLMAQAGIDFPLVQASAEDVPLPDAGFDLVFADHGAFGFTDPYRTVPEAARLLRPGGDLVFSMNTPISDMCWGEHDDDPGTTLVLDYFALRSAQAEGAIDFQLGYGDWIRLFAASGLQALDLIELRPPADAVSSYRSERSRDWARRWPMDHIWKLRKL